ncbi:MAG: RnfABCDGE type electron transport complex subunit G [Anaerovorax sp.]
MKKNGVKEYLAPALTLIIICFVVTAALVATFEVTKPIIADLSKKNADIARAEVLPSGSDGFTDVLTDLMKKDPASIEEGIEEVYKANNDSGFVVTSTDKGFGGKITVMVGIDSQGKMTGVKVTAHTETPGLGTKAMTPEFLKQYVGQEKISNTESSEGTKINAITGATVTSNAVFRAVDKALAQYECLGGAIS